MAAFHSHFGKAPNCRYSLVLTCCPFGESSMNMTAAGSQIITMKVITVNKFQGFLGIRFLKI
jgi:hypothetical protein